MTTAKERYRLNKWRFYRFKSKRPLAELVKLRKKWWRLYQEARAEANPVGLATSTKGVDFIKSYEGFYPNRYNDGVGVQTIGYGTTESDVKPLPLHVTKAEAEKLLARALSGQYETAVRDASKKYGLKLNQHEFDALVSFVYNLGPGSVGTTSGFSTLQKALRSKNRQAIGDALLLYSNPGSSVHAGLLKRRRAERAMFLDGVYDSSH
jgi:lysozyme